MFPLAAANAGDCVKIIKIAGGKKIHARLSQLGLFLNSIYKVISANGPIILSNGRVKIGLGHGIASKIIVEEVYNENIQDCFSR